jgi:hypothetical protein
LESIFFPYPHPYNSPHFSRGSFNIKKYHILIIFDQICYKKY